MTATETKLVERASVYVPAYGTRSNIGELSNALLALVRRLDAENVEIRAELTRLLEVVGEEDHASILRVLNGENQS